MILSEEEQISGAKTDPSSKFNIYFNYISKCNSYLTENTDCLHYKNQSGSAVCGSNRRLLWESYSTNILYQNVECMLEQVL